MMSCRAGSVLSAETPTWQLTQAMTLVRACCSSQHAHGALSACAGIIDATITTGRATQNPAVRSARVAAMRVTKVITSPE